MTQWTRISQKFRATAGRRWGLRFLSVLVVVATFADFLANDRPLVVRYQDEVRWPVFRQYGERLGWLNPYTDLPGRKWTNAETDWAWWPAVPYAPTTIDRSSINFVSPLAEQEVTSLRWRHWLGTDKLGKDVFAGLIHGCRTALLVGIAAMSVALLIGLLVGGPAGYFGNRLLKRPRHWQIGTLAGTVLGLGWMFTSVIPFLANTVNAFLLLLLFIILVPLIILLFRWLFRQLARWWPALKKEKAVPIDFFALRVIEIFNSIPTLILLIVALSFIPQPSILTVMIIIGLVRWTGIARFVRAELMKIRDLPYLEAARLSGLSHTRVLFRHALPNALGPVMVALAFGMAGAILVEAFLAFLGLGLPTEAASWGRLLAASRSEASAWWLAVFPGLAIFFTVLSLNLLGEALREEV